MAPAHIKYLLLLAKSSSFLCLIVAGFYEANAQQRVAPDIYLIRFTDKKNNAYSIARPHEFLSIKAIERRSKQNIVFDETDLPVTQMYVDSLKKAGLEIMNVSKWMNAVSVMVTDILCSES
jgi:hypothetical protein